MSAVWLHLAVVHLPIVLTLAALVLLGLAAWRRSELVFQIACGFLLVSALLAIAAYYSGPEAYEVLEAELRAEKDRVEDHAVLGRSVFVGMIVVGVGALQALLQFLQGESPAKWHRWALFALTLVMCYLFAWTAHLGGGIRHPEIRGVEIPIFPELPGD